MKPTRKLPRRLKAMQWRKAWLLSTEYYWRGFNDGAREQAALAPHTPWTDTEINAYYARTRGY